MSWREQVEPDWFHEAPFYLAAIIAHGALLSINPVIQWGSLAPPEKAVPVEFVAEIPLPPTVSPPLPHLAPGGDGSNTPPKHGPGEFESQKVKQGAVDPPPKPKPVAKPAAAKSKVNKPGTTVHKAKAAPKPKPLAKPDAQAAKFAREAQAESKRLRAERDRAVRAEAAEHAAAARAEAAELAAEKRRIAAEKAADAKAERDRFAAAQRAERERRAAIARAEAERRAEAAREAAERRAAALAEQKRLAAEAKAAKAAKRAELSSALATMSDPDVALSADVAPAPSGRGSARKGRPAAGGPVAGKGGDGGAFGDSDAGDGGGLGGGQAELAGARKAGAAAALAESTDPGDAAGSGGADLIDSKAKGGGVGPEGGGVSWSVDGPVGDRRILSRVSPQSPDWVATRNLDLTVTVRFQVLPNGSIKSGAVIQKTSGFPDIDSRALKALARWRFQPVPAKSGAAEVWGRVTFRFTS
ncbi:MAG: TonB family protein [Elusimicrobia bacterium]|nr:TonB family protein [Elusimicrobiota bacterium]